MQKPTENGPYHLSTFFLNNQYNTVRIIQLLQPDLYSVSGPLTNTKYFYLVRSQDAKQVGKLGSKNSKGNITEIQLLQLFLLILKVCVNPIVFKLEKISSLLISTTLQTSLFLKEIVTLRLFVGFFFCCQLNVLRNQR